MIWQAHKTGDSRKVSRLFQRKKNSALRVSTSACHATPKRQQQRQELPRKAAVHPAPLPPGITSSRVAAPKKQYIASSRSLTWRLPPPGPPRPWRKRRAKRTRWKRPTSAVGCCRGVPCGSPSSCALPMISGFEGSAGSRRPSWGSGSERESRKNDRDPNPRAAATLQSRQKLHTKFQNQLQLTEARPRNHHHPQYISTRRPPPPTHHPPCLLSRKPPTVLFSAGLPPARTW